MTDITERLENMIARRDRYEVHNANTEIGDLFREARAEILRLRAESEWQPIETAPRDGKAILLHVPECLSAYLVSWGKYTASGKHICFGWLIFGGGYREHLQRATHWRRLPTPPEAEG